MEGLLQFMFVGLQMLVHVVMDSFDRGAGGSFGLLLNVVVGTVAFDRGVDLLLD